MKHSPQTKGVVLFAHGSRDPLWNKPVEAVATQMATLSCDVPVVCAYLELCAPDLATAAQTLLSNGVQSITIVPLFLGVGRHAREDLPMLVEAMRAQHPGIEFTLQPAVGEDPRLVQLLAQIALEGS